MEGCGSGGGRGRSESACFAYCPTAKQRTTSHEWASSIPPPRHTSIQINAWKSPNSPGGCHDAGKEEEIALVVVVLVVVELRFDGVMKRAADVGV